MTKEEFIKKYDNHDKFSDSELEDMIVNKYFFNEDILDTKDTILNKTVKDVGCMILGKKNENEITTLFRIKDRLFRIYYRKTAWRLVFPMQPEEVIIKNKKEEDYDNNCTQLESMEAKEFLRRYDNKEKFTEEEMGAIANGEFAQLEIEEDNYKMETIIKAENRFFSFRNIAYLGSIYGLQPIEVNKNERTARVTVWEDK